MGAAASVNDPNSEIKQLEAADYAEDKAVAAEKVIDTFQNSNALPELNDDFQSARDEIVGMDLNGQIQLSETEMNERISQVSALVGDNQKMALHDLITSVKEVMNSDQLKQAVSEIENTIPLVTGDAVLVEISAALQAAALMAPEVVANVGMVLVQLGEHLPYMGVACAAIAGIMHAFKVSKENDENVRNVTLWIASVKDWLLLVAEKVDHSGAGSTIPLFQGLQDALLHLSSQIQKNGQKWRITKMLCSTQFSADFARAKTAVLELKNALRDFLDQESQDRQEKSLENIASAQLDTNEKLVSMNDQLIQIRAMLEAQAEKAKGEEEAQKNKVASNMQVLEEEENIFVNLQRAAGVSEVDDIPFRRFVLVFESFFFAGANLPPEQLRGLKIAISLDSCKCINKAMWIKFYRAWLASDLEMEMFLNTVAENNPTLFVKGLKLSENAISIAKEEYVRAIVSTQAVLGEYGISSTEDAKKVLAEKAKEFGKFGLQKFGSLTHSKH